MKHITDWWLSIRRLFFAKKKEKIKYKKEWNQKYYDRGQVLMYLCKHA